MQAVFLTSGGRGQRVGIKTARLLKAFGGRQGQTPAIGLPRLTLRRERHEMPRYGRCSNQACPGSSTSDLLPVSIPGAKPARASGGREDLRADPPRRPDGCVRGRADPRRRRALPDRRLLASRAQVHRGTTCWLTTRDHHRFRRTAAFASHWNVRPDILSFAKGVTSVSAARCDGDARDQGRHGLVKPDDRWMHAYTNRAIRPAARSR
jgi:hypothetical protein